MPSLYVPPKGPLNAQIALVGEQPGRNEVRRPDLGPFSGPAGDNLHECLRAAGIAFDSCYRTNVIKDLDAPLAHYMEIKRGKIPQYIVHPTGEQYITALREELSAVRCNVIVALGNVALWALTSRVGITSWRGSVLLSSLVPLRKVVPTIHPATWTGEKLRENPDAYLNKYLVTMDLKRARAEASFSELRTTGRKFLIRPTFYEALEFIAICERAGIAGHTIDYDIELQPYNQELSCIGLAFSAERAMCIPFVDERGDYFSPEQELHIMQALEVVFNDVRIRKRGQNVIFDSHYLLRKYGIRTHNLRDDTMIAQGILWPEFRKGLEFITSVWTDIPYYKRDGKVWLSGDGTYEQGWQYNCLDVISCAAAHPAQLSELRSQGNEATYQRQCRLIEPLTYMMEHGILVDKLGMQSAQRAALERAKELTQRVHALIGREININSPDQLCKYFYEELRIKPYKNPDTGRPTVDVTALTRIASGTQERPALPVASMILEIRKLTKRASTFLNVDKIDADGRIRCQYNPVGTKYGRISSSENIFGTGTNLQNQPHEVLTHFLADPGYIIYSLDMSQIENRIVAYVGAIAPMIEAFKNGRDVHRLTASMICNILGLKRTYDEVSSSEREIFGKRPNHAFNYGYGPQSFALKYETPLAYARAIHTAYHKAYPALRTGYWSYVQRELRQRRALTTLHDRYIPFFSRWSDKLLHEAYSAIPQGTCGDHVNEYGINFTYYNSAPHFRCVELMTAIHDSMEIQLPLSEPLATHARVLMDIRNSLERPFKWCDRTFVVPVDLTINTCLNKEIGVELKSHEWSKTLSVFENQLLAGIRKLGANNERAGEFHPHMDQQQLVV